MLDVRRFLLLSPHPLVLNAVLVIIAAIQASDGKFYRPMTIRFIQYPSRSPGRSQYPERYA
jgi:uncharacterized Tic20 family protein